MTIRVLDPTFGDADAGTRLIPGLQSMEGATIGLLDNGKINVRGLLDHVEEIFRSRYAVGNVIRFKKPDASRPVPPDVIEEMKGCEAVISAVGD